MRVQHVTRSFGRGDSLIVIEKIPYVSCSGCGERYFTAATMREIERIKVERRRLTRRKPVPVASFGVA